MIDKKTDAKKPVLTFEGREYLINDLSKDVKEILKGLQIAETQLKMHEDTLKLLSISRTSLVNQLREQLKKITESVDKARIQNIEVLYAYLVSLILVTLIVFSAIIY